MYSGWLVAGIVLSTIASVVVWTMILSMLFSWLRGRHHHRHAR
jgi:hypothetical protein